MLNRDRIVSQLNSDYTVTVLAEIPSTNTALKEMAAQDTSIGTTLIAARQTGGRGRLGRQFHSPEGGLYLSTLIAPTDTATCCAAVAAARAIESLCPLTIDIKWVNDLFLRGRKVAGILAEGVLSPEGTLSAVVLGIGINLCGTLPTELDTIATTLAQEGFSLTREAVAAAFLNEWERTESDPAWMAEYRRRNLVMGREVTVLQGNTTYPATAIAITDEGHLVVRTAHGETELSSGEVSVRL